MSKHSSIHPPTIFKSVTLVLLLVVAGIGLVNMAHKVRVFAAALPSIIYDNNLFICTAIPCSAAAPSAEGNLIVEGALKITGGSPGAGKILTSDANGVATWETPSFSASGWTDDGTVVRLTTIGDTVGIGTTTPANKLHVVGTSTLGNTDIDASGNLEVNNDGTGNRYGFVDLHGDDTYTDYGARFLRENTGANANTQIYHRGTGILNLTAAGNTNVNFWTNGANRLAVNSDGGVVIGNAIAGFLFNVNGGSSIMRWDRGDNQGGGIQGQLELNNNHVAAGGSEPVWMSFNREGVLAGNFSLQTDNYIGLRRTDGATYYPLTSGLQSMGYNTAPLVRFIDTDNTDWFMYLQDDNNIVWGADANNDGTMESWPMYMTNTVLNVNNLECSNCIDSGDLKTATGVISAAVPATTQMADYMFFPNIEYHTCAVSNQSANVLRPFQGNAADNFIGLYSTYVTCNSGAWAVRFRYIAASRDPEIFGWYDPVNGILRSVWINEVSLDSRDQLPMTFLEEHPEWIPVQATLFDRDLARLGQDNIDANDILRNFTFTRVAKASDLNQNDELVATITREHQECLAKAKADQGSLDNAEGKCPQLITHPDVYYGKLERSETAGQSWDRVDREQLQVAQANKYTTGADIAENYTGATDVTPGEIVAIDRAQNNFLVRATAAESQQLAGVVSTSPGQVLGQKQSNNVELALIGRVPVKMSQSSLPVQAGDMITVSAEAGKGAKATQAGWVVGKALESWEPGSDRDTVMVLLNTTVYDPQLVQRSLEGYQLTQNSDGSFSVTDIYNQAVNRVLALRSLLVAHLEVGLLKATELEIAGVDIAIKLAGLDKRLTALEDQSPSQVVGHVTFPSTARTILVNDSRVTEDTAILLTPRTITNQHPAVTEVRPGVGFVISVPQGGQEMSLDYWFME